MRGIQQVPGLTDVKGMHSIGARSIPKVQRASHLELYMFQKEKDRLEKEIFVLDKKKGAAGRQLDAVVKRIERLQKETGRGQRVKIYRDVPAKHLKTMTITY